MDVSPSRQEPDAEEGADDTAQFIRDLEYATRPDWNSDEISPTLAWRDRDDTYDYEPDDE